MGVAVGVALSFAPSSAAAVDDIAPDTTITSGPPPISRQFQSSFTFSSDDPTAYFHCQIDGLDRLPCQSSSPWYLQPGRHTFTVAAVDLARNEDPTPARYDFEIRSEPLHPILKARSVQHQAVGHVGIRLLAGADEPVTVEASAAIPRFGRLEAEPIATDHATRIELAPSARASRWILRRTRAGHEIHARIRVDYADENGLPTRYIKIVRLTE